MIDGNVSFWLSIIATVMAIYAICQTNINIEFNQFQIILNLYSSLKDLEKDLFKYQVDGEFESAILYEFTQEAICNHYEICCIHYLRRSINRKLFRDLFKANIIRIVNNKDYKMFFYPEDKSKYDYCNVLKVYSKFMDNI